MLLRSFVAAVLVVGLPTLLQAQYGGNRPQNNRQPAGAQVEIQGKLQNIGKNGIVVLDANNLAWKVACVPMTKVHVTGVALPTDLRTGQVIEFTATIDNRGAIQDRVSRLTITSLRDKQMGVFPTDADASSGRYRVVGRLIVGRGMLSVQAGRGATQFQLSDKPKIKIDTSDMTIVARGTDVTVRGFMAPNRPGFAQAAEITVKLPVPEGAAQEEPAENSEKKDAPVEKKDAPADK